VPEDPDLRREVAAALLFSREDAPPAQGHPSSAPQSALETGAAADATAQPETSPTDGAPLAREHPPAPSTTDAPPADGHPSPSPRTAALRDQIREITGLMGERLALIDEKKEKS
jgi:hypothetical protein